MSHINDLLEELDEATIANKITNPHDEARMRFPLRRNIVADYPEFIQLLGDYYAYHFSLCVANGGTISKSQAQQSAKQTVENHMRRQNGDIATAYENCRTGVQGGMRILLDAICDTLKSEAVERHVGDVFDRHVLPVSWSEKLTIIEEFLKHCQAFLGDSIDVSDPARYAASYRPLIQAYTEGLTQTARAFRRL